MMVFDSSNLCTSILQCLVNVLKSLVDWEKARRESKEQDNLDDVSDRESSEMNKMDDVPRNFEKAKAHKSSLEAAISEASHSHY